MRKRLFLCSDRQLRHFRQVGGVRQRPLVHQGKVRVRVLHVLLLSLVVEMLLLIFFVRALCDLSLSLLLLFHPSPLEVVEEDASESDGEADDIELSQGGRRA